jgi:hypothetical protein
LTQFAGVVDIGFPKAASKATFIFTQELVQVNASIPSKADQITNVGD